MPIRSWPLAIVLLSCLCLTGAALAQTSSTTGEITGRVVDDSEGALPGVTVTATNADTGLSRIAVTGAEGEYTLGLLPPGTYSLTAELSGFRTATREDLTVLLGTATTVRLTLAPELSEEITVTSEAPVVDTTQADLTLSVTQEQIENLPILGRDFSDLVFLTPGATPAFGDRVALNGGRGIQTDYNIDGAEANSDFFGEERGGTEAPFVFSQAAIREFQVIRSTYSAEYARGVGATVNAVTKSGTNDLSGEVFWFRRDADWAEEQPTTIGDQEVADVFEARDSDQYGFAVGGPIVRDRFHFFVNGDFQEIAEPLFTGDVRTSSAFRALPADVQAAFVQRLEGTIGPLDQQFRFDSREDQDTYLAKVDANLAQNHHVVLRHNYADFNNFPSEGPFDILSNNGDEFNTVNSTVLQLDSIFGADLANSLIVQYGVEERPIDALTTDVPETIIQGLSNFTFGQSEFLPNRTDEEKWQLRDSVTWFRGDHQVKAGFEYLQTEVDNLFPREIGGQWFFSTAQDFLANRPNRLDQGFGPTLGLNAFDYDAWGVFVQDTVTLDNLTLDFGIRYDAQSIPEPVGNAYPFPEFVDDFNDDTDNFAPRAGFAWDVRGDGRSVLRGGVGQYHNFLPSILYAGPLSEIAGLYNRVTVLCNQPGACPDYPNLLTPERFAQIARTNANVTTVSPDLEAAESLRGSLAYEQQLGTSYSVSLEGVYAQIDKAQRLININVVPTGIVYGDLVVYDTRNPNRRYPTLNNVLQHVSDAEGEYASLTLATRKLALGDSRFTWLAHYTWSEAIDQDSNERSTSTSFSLDPFNPGISEGRADYDVTHRVVAAGTYELPWQILVSGILSWRSGIPYTIGIDTTGLAGLNGLDAQGVNTPAFVDGNGNLIDLTLANGLTRQGFSDFLAARGGRMIERNSEDQPDVTNLDLRISKTFDLGFIGLELIGEVFNALDEENEFVTVENQTQFVGTLSSAGIWTFTRNPDFGKENSFVGTPRQFQAAVKVRF